MVSKVALSCYILGKILYKQGKIHEALICYEKACELDHSDYETKIERGKN
jgi:tetratricopeptide (TPR) repeat protein